MDFNQMLVVGLALIMIAIGVAGAVLPALPGLPMVFGGLWALSWVGAYERVGEFTLAVLAVMLVIGMALDFIAGSIGAKRFGASPQAVAGSLIGAFVGVFFGLPGLILGPFLGAVAGEIKARRPLEQAAFSGLGAWIGLLLGVVAKLVITVVMISVFAFDYFI